MHPISRSTRPRSGAPFLFCVLLALPCTLLGTSALALEAPAPEVLWDIGTAPSAERIERDITRLVSFGTRHTLSETESDTRGIGAARRWILAEFNRISAACGDCLEIMIQRETVSGERRIPEPTEVVNVIAILRGQTEPNRFVMMSGDIDSRISDPLNATDDAPGANDNASGMAGVLEAARVLSQYRFRASIIFAGLSGEEQGLFGGRHLAKFIGEAGWDLQGVLNNDMIGNIAGLNGVIDNTSARVFSEGTRAVETAEEARRRRFTGGEVDSPSRNLARFVHAHARYVPNLDLKMIYRLDRFGRGGHHRPFNEAGYPGVRIMETNEHYERQHQDLRTENGVTYGDTIDFVDFDYAAKLTALNAVVLAAMAWAPAPPADVTIEGAVQADTHLAWVAKSPAEVAGYSVHWRDTTAPVWEQQRFVGDVTAFTLENLVIDNYFFGVSARSPEGFDSPVVFPGPAGAFWPQAASDE
ncbi:MAG TPA: M28 family peptidase [Pseudomonadales bacterium]|nr:M28 family peptidase [Pseudomonadales bacterium]